MTHIAPDYGPTYTTDAGKVRPIKGRHLQTVADPADKNRTIRRAHAIRYVALKGISEPQRQACDRYLTQAERSEGAKWRNGEAVGRVTASAATPHPEWQLAASSDLRRARAAIGGTARRVLDMFIIANASLPAIGKQFGWNDHGAKQRVMAALDRLVEHWFPVLGQSLEEDT